MDWTYFMKTSENLKDSKTEFVKKKSLDLRLNKKKAFHSFTSHYYYNNPVHCFIDCLKSSSLSDERVFYAQSTRKWLACTKSITFESL